MKKKAAAQILTRPLGMCRGAGNEATADNEFGVGDRIRMLQG